MPAPRTLREEQAVREVRGVLEARRDESIPAGMCPGGSSPAGAEATLCRFALANWGRGAGKAAAHLREVREWRGAGGLAHGLDADNALRAHLPGNKSATIRKYLPHGTIGYDREGRPVYLEHAAELANRFRQMEREGVSAEEMLAYRVQMMEYIYHRCFPQASERASRPVDQLRVILDLSGLRLKGLKSVATMRHYRAVVKMYTLFYPENLHSLYIVNAPQFFHTAVWPFLRVRLNARLLRKVKVIRRHEHTRLHKYISEGNLPNYLGGELDCAAGGILSACWADMDQVINEQLKPEYLKETPHKPGRSGGQLKWQPKPWQHQKLQPMHAPVQRVPVRRIDSVESDSESEMPGTPKSIGGNETVLPLQETFRNDSLAEALKSLDVGSPGYSSFGDLQNALSGSLDQRSIRRRGVRHLSLVPSASSDERESPSESENWSYMHMTPEKIEGCLEDLEDAHLVIARQEQKIRMISIFSGILAAALGALLLFGWGLEHLGRAQLGREAADLSRGLRLPDWLVNLKIV